MFGKKLVLGFALMGAFSHMNGSDSAATLPRWVIAQTRLSADSAATFQDLKMACSSSTLWTMRATNLLSLCSAPLTCAVVGKTYNYLGKYTDSIIKKTVASVTAGAAFAYSIIVAVAALDDSLALKNVTRYDSNSWTLQCLNRDTNQNLAKISIAATAVGIAGYLGYKYYRNSKKTDANSLQPFTGVVCCR